MTAELDLACHVNALVPDAAPERLASALPTIADLGYQRAVLPPLDPEATDVVAVRALFEENGLVPITMAGQAPGADVSSEDDAEAAAGAAALRARVDLAVALGSDQLNGVPYGLFGHPSAPLSAARFERAAVAVGGVADYAHERGVAMTFEVLNRYETSAVNTAVQAMQFVEQSGSEHLGIHLDTFHMAIEEADMRAAIRHALPRLGYLELGQSGRGLLSTGVVDIAGVVAQAIADGYTGRWGIEAFSRPLLVEPAADMLAIWRTPYPDGAALAADAVRVIRGTATAARQPS